MHRFPGAGGPSWQASARGGPPQPGTPARPHPNGAIRPQGWIILPLMDEMALSLLAIAWSMDAHQHLRLADGQRPLLFVLCED